MATFEQNRQRFQEIANRGLQDRLDFDKRARFDEAMKRGLISFPEQTVAANQAPEQPPQEPLQPELEQGADSLGNGSDEKSSGLVNTGLEFAAGVNRSALGLLDFLGPDQINALLEVSGSEKRVPTLSGSEIGKQATTGGFLEEGLARDIVSAAGEVSGAAIAPQQAIRGAAQQLPKIAAGAEGVLPGFIRKAGAQTAEQAAITGAAAGAGAEVGGSLGEEIGGEEGRAVGEVIGGFAAPMIPVSKIAATGKALRQPIDQAAGKDLSDVLKRGTVLTSDVFPPDTPAKTVFRRFSERFPVIGTGGVRAEQQKERVESVANVLDEFGVDSRTDFATKIVKSLEDFSQKATKKGHRLRSDAIDKLTPLGDVPVKNSIKNIDGIIAKEKAAGKLGDSALINKLGEIKSDISGRRVQDPLTLTEKTIRPDFSDLANTRTRIFQTISDFNRPGASILRSGADKHLQQLAGSLTRDLDDFAKKNSSGGSGNLFAKWKAGNRLLKSEIKKTTETDLKNALIKGDVTPELINNVLRSGRRSSLTRLNKALTPEGRTDVKQSFLNDALDKSTVVGSVNPTRFVNFIDAPKNRLISDIFFKGDDKRRLDGFKKFVKITQRAQELNVGPATQLEASMIGFGLLSSPTKIITALFAPTSRIIESRAARDMMIKLSNKGLSKKSEKAILARLIPAVRALQQEDEQEPASQ
jgi:hypothetical protein